MPGLTVERLLGDLAAELDLAVVAGAKGLGNCVSHNRIQRPGLALAGCVENLDPGHLQVMGGSEMTYLDGLTSDQVTACLMAVTAVDMPAAVVSQGRPPLPAMTEAFARRSIPLLSSTADTRRLIDTLNGYLEGALAPVATVHGVLMDVLSVGVLLRGKSGVGKSECALDLLMRGGRLVADDVVTVRRMPSQAIWGFADDGVRNRMEVRGLGIINVRELFGVAAVRTGMRIELVMELEPFDPACQYDRLGVERRSFDLLGVSLPCLKLPVGQGRNLAGIVEVAVRSFLLTQEGVPAADRQRLWRQGGGVCGVCPDGPAFSRPKTEVE